MLLNIFIGLTTIVVLWLSGREVRAYLQARGAMPLRRLTLRLTTAAMLLSLLISLYLGVHVFDLATPNGLPKHWLAFWGSLLLLAGGILCMVLADLRMMQDDAHRNTTAMWRDIADTIAAHRKTSAQERTPDDP